MKTNTAISARFSVRLRPGGLLLIRPTVLRRLGWSAKTDEILFELNGNRVTVFQKPTEVQWRIERLRKRLDPNRALPSPGYEPLTLSEFRSRYSPRRKSTQVIDVASRHKTLAGGNVFEDLGFAPDEAKALLADSRRRIEDSLNREHRSCS